MSSLSRNFFGGFLFDFALFYGLISDSTKVLNHVSVKIDLGQSYIIFIHALVIKTILSDGASIIVALYLPCSY